MWFYEGSGWDLRGASVGSAVGETQATHLQHAVIQFGFSSHIQVSGEQATQMNNLRVREVSGQDGDARVKPSVKCPRYY